MKETTKYQPQHDEQRVHFLLRRSDFYDTKGRTTGMHEAVYALANCDLGLLEEFGEYISDIGYGDCMYSYPNMPYSYRQCEDFLKRARSVVGGELRLALRLLALGEHVHESEISRTGLRRFIPILESNGIIARCTNDSIRTAELQCRVVDGCFLFVTRSTGPGEIVAYFGDDSIKLSRHLIGYAGQSALDVCCGSGIQSILMARRGLDVTGVDIQAGALRLAAINSAMNHVSDRTTFVLSDIHEYVPHRPFDVLVSNPPLIPVPTGMCYSIVGDGGENGMAVAQGIVSRLDDLVSEDGRAVIVGMCPGSSDQPEVATWLDEARCSIGISCLVLLCARLDITPVMEFLTTTSSNQFGEELGKSYGPIAKLYASRKTGYVYAFVLKIFRGHGESRLTVLPLYRKGKSVGWYTV